MKTNFSFLKDQKELKDIFIQAEAMEMLVNTYPTGSMNICRPALETTIKRVYTLVPPLDIYNQNELTLFEMLYNNDFKGIINNEDMINNLTYIRKIGNQSIHNDDPIERKQALICIEYFFEFLKWIVSYCYEKDVKNIKFNKANYDEAEQISDEEAAKKLERALFELEKASRDIKKLIAEKQNIEEKYNNLVAEYSSKITSPTTADKEQAINKDKQIADKILSKSIFEHSQLRQSKVYSISANYIDADYNFDILNVDQIKNNTDKNHSELLPFYSVIFNLLQRGENKYPARLSKRYREKNAVRPIKRKLNFFSNKAPNVGNLIKGANPNNNPARDFYYEVIPQYFANFPFLQQLIIPEAEIQNITNDPDCYFTEQKVDFYLEKFNLVIEIDGSQHQVPVQQILDKRRDSYLKKYGIDVIRIPTNKIRDKYYLDMIYNHIVKYTELLSIYKMDYELCTANKMPVEFYNTTATMRLQMAILWLCINNKLSINDKQWNIHVTSDKASSFAIFAVEELLLKLNKIFILAGKDQPLPQLNIEEVNDFNNSPNNVLKIDLNIATKISSEDLPQNEIITVANSWYQSSNNFKLQTTKAIDYNIPINKHNSSEPNEQINNPQSQALKFFLQEIYGFDDFKPGQENIIINSLNRKDTIGILPTGAGKSICFQLPVLLQPCISFCVSPIKALMHDQVLNLNKNFGIGCVSCIDSDLTAEERTTIQRNYWQKKYHWIYISPERFQSESFRVNISQLSKSIDTFGYAAIDEVHCMSEWGHNFRVSYLNLVKTIRRFCKGAILIGLTATASFRTLNNIKLEFGLSNNDNVFFRDSFSRDELHFEVIDTDDKYKTLTKIFENENRGIKETVAGIIFTPHVNWKYGCYPLSNKLSAKYKANVACFSGSMPKDFEGTNKEWAEYKQSVQNHFKQGELNTICCTKAFGMGIDKPDVRYTAHYGFPSSLESLYQEAGRAGRDGKDANCYVLYTEEQNDQDEMDKIFSPTCKIDTIKKYVGKKFAAYRQEDLGRQLSLMTSGIVDTDQEVECIKKTVQKIDANNKKKIIFSKTDKSFDIKNEDGSVVSDADNSIAEKIIYHLSILGVVDDWTVDWKSNSIIVEPKDYSIDSIVKATKNNINAYDYSFDFNSKLTIEDKDDRVDAAVKCAKIYLNWYYENIIYSRKQSLYNVMKACADFNTLGAEQFKQTMEDYFRLNKVAAKFQKIVDGAGDITPWKEVLNSKFLSENNPIEAQNTLNRFLVEYNNNPGLNLVSGVLSYINSDFYSPNGKERLDMAFDEINKMDEHAKEYAIKQTCETYLSCNNSKKDIEKFSEKLLDSCKWNNAPDHVYKYLNDDYSLSLVLSNKLDKMSEIVERN